MLLASILTVVLVVGIVLAIGHFVDKRREAKKDDEQR